jgi:hypothetical protein
LTGNATLINVASGFDLGYKADALADLTLTPMYSNPGQSGADFDAFQVTPVSYFSQGSVSYRLNWARGADAVTSLFMATAVDNEFILHPATRSHTDWVITFPTRRLYVTSAAAQSPFSAAFGTQFNNCEGVYNNPFDREGKPASTGSGFPVPPASGNRACWSANAFSIRRLGDSGSTSESDVFHSQNVLLTAAPPGALLVPASFEAGRISLRIEAGAGMTSLATSIAVDMQTGAATQSAYRLFGLPLTGFMARTFENGTLSCDATSCQGNYSAAFVHDKTRAIQQVQ